MNDNLDYSQKRKELCRFLGGSCVWERGFFWRKSDFLPSVVLFSGSARYVRPPKRWKKRIDKLAGTWHYKTIKMQIEQKKTASLFTAYLHFDWERVRTHDRPTRTYLAPDRRWQQFGGNVGRYAGGACGNGRDHSLRNTALLCAGEQR